MDHSAPHARQLGPGLRVTLKSIEQGQAARCGEVHHCQLTSHGYLLILFHMPVAPHVIVAPRSLREDEYESKVNLGYIVRAY